MICPFTDPVDEALCMVRRIARELPPVCAEDRSDHAWNKSYRCCTHYELAMLGGLETFLLRAEKDRNNGASARGSGT